MKQLFYLIITTIFFLACSQSDDIIDTIEQPENTSDSTILVGINLIGDVTIDESVLTRSETESTDLIGIQVYRNESRYCFGLFDNMQDLKVALKAGYSYKFVCTMIKDFKNLYDGNNYNGYPFYAGSYIAYTVTGKPWNKWVDNTCDNTFYYDLNRGEEVLQDGRVSWKAGDSGDYCRAVDRFYGEIQNYTPTVNGNIEIPLRRVSFGIKMRVSGLTDGNVSIKCWHNNGTKYVFYDNSSITNDFEGETKIFSLYNIYNAWQYADADYQEAVKLSVIWTRGNGIVQDLGTKTAYVKRNAVNVFKIKLSTNDKDVDVDVDVDPEGGDMDSEDEDLSN